MIRLFAVLLTIALASAGYAQERTPADCGAKSENQIGGQTACSIVNYRSGGEPQRAKVAAAMVLLTQARQSLLDMIGGAGYIGVYDASDQQIVSKSDGAVYLAFFAGSKTGLTDYFRESDLCDVDVDHALIGLVVTEIPGRTLKLAVKTLPSGNRLVLQMCRGLASRELAQQTEGANQSYTNYDMLASELTDSVLFVLVPSDLYGMGYEERLTENYWTGISGGTDLPDLIKGLIRRYGTKGAGDMLNRFQETGELQVTLDLRESTFMFGPTKPLRVSASRIFGPEAANMEAKWLSFIQKAHVPIRGEMTALMEAGTPKQLLPRYRAADIGSARFWPSIRDGNDLTESVNCLAVIFAVDGQYAGLNELPSYRKCVPRVSDQ